MFYNFPLSNLEYQPQRISGFATSSSFRITLYLSPKKDHSILHRAICEIISASLAKAHLHDLVEYIFCSSDGFEMSLKDFQRREGISTHANVQSNRLTQYEGTVYSTVRKKSHFYGG